MFIPLIELMVPSDVIQWIANSSYFDTIWFTTFGAFIPIEPEFIDSTIDSSHLHQGIF